MIKAPIFLILIIFLLYEHGSVFARKKKDVVRGQGYQVHRIHVRDQEDAQQLKSLEDEQLFDFWNDIRVGGYVDIMTTPINAVSFDQWIDQRGMQSDVSIKDLENLVKKKSGPEKGKYSNKMVSKFGGIEEEEIMDWTGYHSLEAIYKWFTYLESTFDFCQTESIGKSYEGQDMIIMKVCRGGCGHKPAIWIDSGIHAREWITISTGTWMLNELVTNDLAHPELTQSLDWYFLPSHNPDGYRLSRDNKNMWANRFWRKSTRLQNTKGECGEWVFDTGTDMNRNWGYHWAEEGASNSSCSATYHGPKPWSEVEVENVRNFLLEHKDEIKLYQTLHAFSQVILMPWAYTEEKSPRYEAMRELALRGAKEMKAKHGKNYEVGCIPCLMYPASGNSLDWALGVAGIPYTYCIELRDEGEYGFVLPEDQIVPTAEEAWAWHLVAAKQIIREFTNQSQVHIDGDSLVDANQTIQQETHQEWVTYGYGQNNGLACRGDPIQPDPFSPFASLQRCKEACRIDSSCEGILRMTKDKQRMGICFLRKNIKLESCEQDTKWTLHKKNYTDVSCGEHMAVNCSSCGLTQQLCKGDCQWIEGKCTKQDEFSFWKNWIGPFIGQIADAFNITELPKLLEEQ